MNNGAGLNTGLINNLPSSFVQAFKQMQPYDVVDIIILALILYQLIKVTRETRAKQLLNGLGIILIAAQVSQWLNLIGVTWILNSFVVNSPLVLVVLFQPELRRALERLGSGKLSDNSILPRSNDLIAGSAADEIIRSVQNLAKKRVGALIALQRGNTLNHIVESGTILDAQVTSQLVENIFVPNSPLHDGAMIIRGERIVAAGCFLPLAASAQVDPELGTRHRAAIGMTETTDALVIIVSEETGIISVAESGRLIRYLDASGLKQEISKVYGRKDGAGRGLNGFIRRRKNGNEKRS